MMSRKLRMVALVLFAAFVAGTLAAQERPSTPGDKT
jgi:hypothetical protein